MHYFGVKTLSETLVPPPLMKPGDGARCKQRGCENPIDCIAKGGSELACYNAQCANDAIPTGAHRSIDQATCEAEDECTFSVADGKCFCTSPTPLPTVFDMFELLFNSMVFNVEPISIW